MSLAALSELLQAADCAPPDAGQLEIHGDDPVLPLRYRVGAAGAASLAALGLAAARLWELRSGRSQ